MIRANQKIGSKASASVRSKRTTSDGAVPHGRFHVVCRDSEGNIKWIEDNPNIVTNQGLDLLLDWISGVVTTVPTNVYVVLNRSATTPGASIVYGTRSTATWQEVTTAQVSLNTRPTWRHNAKSSQSIDNSGTEAQFGITATVTIEGAGLVFSYSDHTGARAIGNTAATNGVLYSLSKFASPKNVDSGDTLSVTVTLTAADDGV